MMNHEFDVEALHSAAGLALARAGLLDAAQPLAESKIGVFDRVLQGRSVNLVGERVDEGGVAFKLGEAERGTQRPDQRVHDVGDDILGMVEFDARDEMRVARYVGDRETGCLRFRKHTRTPIRSAAEAYRPGPGNASNYHATSKQAS